MTSFATLLPVLPLANRDNRRLTHKITQRDTQLHGRYGCRHTSTVTVTVIDTITREDLQ